MLGVPCEQEKTSSIKDLNNNKEGMKEESKTHQ